MISVFNTSMICLKPTGLMLKEFLNFFKYNSSNVKIQEELECILLLWYHDNVNYLHVRHNG